MNKNKLVNVVLVILIGLSVLLVARETLAATSGNAQDLTNTITGGNSSRNNSAGNSSSGNSSSGGNSSTTTNNSTGSSTTNNSSVMRTNNTSNYNNSSLPKTGIESSFPSIILIVVFGISSVYAYKKIKHYRNI